MTRTPQLKLNSRQTIPGIGLGTWQLGAGREAEETVSEALKIGYRLIDTAKIYANEVSVGEAIAQSGINREDIFVTTKLWPSDFGYEKTKKAFDESLNRLRLGYIDLYLIHWPQHDSQARLESWRAMEEIFKAGRAKAIGVSNFQIPHLEELIENSEIKPAVNQIEFHPFIYDKQKAVLDFCQKHDIAVEAYSPLARARQLNNPLISKVAAKHSKTPAQVMLRWAIQQGTIPIPKSVNPRRIRQNLEVFDFELSEREVEALDGLAKGRSALPLLLRLLK